MTAEGRGTASLNIPHCFDLFLRKWVRVAVFRAVEPKDLGRFKVRTYRRRSVLETCMGLHGSGAGPVLHGGIEGAFGPSYELAAHMGIS